MTSKLSDPPIKKSYEPVSVSINDIVLHESEGAQTDDELNMIVEEGAALPDLTEEDCDEIFYKNQL